MRRGGLASEFALPPTKRFPQHFDPPDINKYLKSQSGFQDHQQQQHQQQQHQNSFNPADMWRQNWPQNLMHMGGNNNNRDDQWSTAGMSAMSGLGFGGSGMPMSAGGGGMMGKANSRRMARSSLALATCGDDDDDEDYTSDLTSTDGMMGSGGRTMIDQHHQGGLDKFAQHRQVSSIAKVFLNSDALILFLFVSDASPEAQL